MCLIIDNDVVAQVLLKPNDPDFSPVSERLFGRKKGLWRLVYGGRLLTEYRGNYNVVRVLAILDQRGAARQFSSDEIRVAESDLSKEANFISNDLHILALARISNARPLISHDKDLHRDFKNPKILNAPRGSVYQYKSQTKTTLTRGKCTTRCGG
jgi:hypothetical protein